LDPTGATPTKTPQLKNSSSIDPPTFEQTNPHHYLGEHSYSDIFERAFITPMLLSVSSTIRGGALCAAACIGFIGCGQPGDVQESDSSPPLYEPAGAARGSGSYVRGQSTRNQQLEFLQRIRQADPRFQTIQRALMNERNELGLVLSPNVRMDEISALMRSMLVQMHKEFPGQDLTIVAYAPADPPVEIGTARLDADSGEMNYTPVNAQQQRRQERFNY
jgi:hypothetical protein